MGHLDELAAQIHQTCVEHGFDVPTVENLPVKLMLSVSELAEALEELRDEKPGLYYVCKDCGAERESPDVTPHTPPRPKGFWAILISLLPLNQQARRCYGKDWKPEGAAVEIADSNIRNLHMMTAAWPDLSIDEVMEIKMAYNEGRPYKHGRVGSM